MHTQVGSLLLRKPTIVNRKKCRSIQIYGLYTQSCALLKKPVNFCREKGKFEECCSKYLHNHIIMGQTTTFAARKKTPIQSQF